MRTIEGAAISTDTSAAISRRLLAHRGVWNDAVPQNSTDALLGALRLGFGIETDLRDHLGSVVVSHDPSDASDVAFDESVLADSALVSSAGMLALNVKADGLVPLMQPWVHSLPVDRHFFFDMSFPQTLAYVRAGLPVAVRVSEFEPLDYALFESLSIPIRVWLDAFDSEWWLDSPAINELCARGQVAVVSPELHGREPYAAWDWFGARIADGSDVYLCTDRCADVIERLS